MWKKIWAIYYFNFMLMCLWHPQSRAFYVKCVETGVEFDFELLKASGASKAALIDAWLQVPRLGLLCVAGIVMDTFYVLRG